MHNDSQSIYAGVSEYLFAIVCQVSLDVGCDGAAAYTSKSDLVRQIYEKAAADLLE